MTSDTRPDLTILAATSGHSGVDTIIRNLVPEFTSAGLRVDILKIRKHGPHLSSAPDGCRIIELPASHIETALPALVRYLRHARPRTLFTDKDSVNRVAIIARQLARLDCRSVVRIGTTVSVNLQKKKPWQAAIEKWSIRNLYRKADAIIVPSQGAADDLANLIGSTRMPIHVVPSPIIHDHLLKGAEAPIDEPWLHDDRTQPVIVAVGALTPRKDYETLIKAFALLRATRPCRLILIGKGSSRTSLEQLANDLNVAKDIRFPGFLPNPYPYMRHADVFAHSSLWEGLAVVLVEALALGTPVVGTDCPSGTAEVLNYGRLGELVPMQDAQAMATALAKVLDNPPAPEVLRASVEKYRTTQSAAAYLKVLNL